MFKTQCPKCRVEGRLEVRSGIFISHGMTLAADGFSFADAKQVDTQDERVECQSCNAVYVLEDLTSD